MDGALACVCVSVCVCVSSPGRRCVDGPTEIGDFDIVVVAEQQVLGLDVAVDDLVLVAVEQRVRQLSHVIRRPTSTQTQRQTQTHCSMMAFCAVEPAPAVSKKKRPS